MSDRASACIGQMRRLGFKPGIQPNIFCLSCSESIKACLDKPDTATIQKYLDDHAGHAGCFFGFSDGRRWEIPNDGGIESNGLQRIEPTVETTTLKEPAPQPNPESDREKDAIPEPDIFEGDTIEDYTWIKLYRKLKKNPIYKDSIAVHLFIHLLLTANHKPNRFIFNEKEITVKRGQLVTGRKQISSEIGISEWAVRKRLRLFEKLGILTRKTTSKFSIITICNYKHYQETSYKNSPDISPAGDGCQTSSNSPATHQQLTTNKNVRSKELKNGRRASKKPDADPRVKEFKNWWRETLLQKKGVPYHFDHAKDGAITKKLLLTFDLPDLKQYAQDFLEGDEQGERMGFTIGVFSQAVNRIAQRNASDPIERIKREKRLRKEREGTE